MRVTAASITIHYLLFTMFAVPAIAVFEDAGTGARATALGGAYTAFGDDTWSLLYNPAGLARVSQPEIVSEYSQLLTGLSDNSNVYQYFTGVSVPLKTYGTAAIGWKQLGLGGLYAEQSVSAGYGNWITSHLAGGVAVKYLRHTFSAPNSHVDDNGNIQGGSPSLFSQNGQARSNASLDLGLLYRISERQHLGFSVLDLNEPNMALDAGDTDRVTRSWHAGWTGENDHRFSLTGDLSAQQCSSCGAPDYTAVGGAEKRWGPVVSGELAARGALAIGSRELRQVSTGGGYRWRNLSLDYAFVFNLSGIAIGTTSGTHRFSLAYRFGANKATVLHTVQAIYPEADEFSMNVLKNPEESSVALVIDPDWIRAHTLGKQATDQ